MVTQRDYLGVKETLLRRIYLRQVKCRECGDARWVKPADVHQVKYCKPCTRKLRLARRRRRATKKVP